MSQLIPTFQGHLDNQSQTLVDARIIHDYLEVGRDFSNWIKARIDDYGFVKNIDFICSPNLASVKNKGLTGFLGGHNRIDYHISLDMAKELSMVERNDKGRQARRYFIACEKAVSDHIPTAYSRKLTNQVTELQTALLKQNPEFHTILTTKNST